MDIKLRARPAWSLVDPVVRMILCRWHIHTACHTDTALGDHYLVCTLCGVQWLYGRRI